MIWKILCAAVVASSFAILFNVRGRNVLLAGVNGGLGYLVYALAMAYAFQGYAAMFWASMAMALWAEFCARLCKAPASLFLAAALIPIVPGGAMFRSALNLLEGKNGLAVTYGMETMLEAGALAAGIIVVSSLTKVCLHRLGRRKQETPPGADQPS